MDDIRAEFSIYSADDIRKGAEFLDEAESQASNAVIRDRIDFLRRDLGFTQAAANAHFAYESCVRALPQTADSAMAHSAEVVRRWAEFNAALDAAEKGPESSASGWHPKTFRVRYWTLRDEMRDAVVAPLVRWIVANEDKLTLAELAEAETVFAEAAIAHLERVSTDRVDAAPFEPRIEPLQVATIPVVGRFRGTWEDVAFVEAAPWRFRRTPPDQHVDRYEEPPENLVEPPAAGDLSVRWKVVADPTALYVLAIVADDQHVQEQPTELMWLHDSLQVALTPDRADAFTRFDQGYGGNDTELGVALGANGSRMHLWNEPADVEKVPQLAQARAFRNDGETVYEVAIDWRLLPGYEPRAGRSFGFSLVVNDADGERYQQAEYGGGVADAKRPKRMSALRLAADLH
jgi:hypothetical protein